MPPNFETVPHVGQVNLLEKKLTGIGSRHFGHATVAILSRPNAEFRAQPLAGDITNSK